MTEEKTPTQKEETPIVNKGVATNTAQLLADLEVKNQKIAELSKTLEEMQGKLGSIDVLNNKLSQYGEFAKETLKSRFEKSSDAVKEYISLDDFADDPLSGIAMLDNVESIYNRIKEDVLKSNPTVNATQEETQTTGNNNFDPMDRKSVLAYISKVQSSKKQ